MPVTEFDVILALRIMHMHNPLGITAVCITPGWLRSEIMLETFGVMRDYFADRGERSDADRGRMNVTGREEDRHVFRVPSLRNVATTAPYFHDGSAQTLDEAVKVMARYQLGRELESAEVGAIVAFLGSLTGEYRKASR